MIRRCARFLLVLVAALGFGSELRADALRVVTTTSQIGDIARMIAQDRASVESLMGEGVDPHTYRQTRADVAKLSRAGLVLHNGLYLEAQLEDLFQKLGAKKPVVAVAEGIDPDKLLSHPSYPGKFDPHIWMDVALWSDAAGVILEALVKHDPGNAEFYRSNAAAIGRDLEKLQAYAGRVLASIPKQARALISAHDAFGYFGRAYDFDVIGIQGLSTESEAGLAHIENVVELIIERDIKAVFVESSVASRNVKALIEGAAARGHDVSIGGELFSDAMGPSGAYEGSYIGMIDHNVTTIARALGGTAPTRGLHSRLGEGS